MVDNKKGYYTLEDISEELNKHIHDAQGPMEFKYDFRRKKVIMILLIDNSPEGLIEMKHENDKCCICMNDNLNKILGISDKP